MSAGTKEFLLDILSFAMVALATMKLIELLFG